MILAIEFTLGITYIVVGLSCLFRANVWQGWLEKTRAGGSQTAVLLGTLGLMVCAFIVSAHPVFHGPPMLITVLGIIGMIKNTVYLLFPRSLAWLLKFFISEKSTGFRILSAVSVILGILILMIWWPNSGF